jgi:hypothetical protein
VNARYFTYYENGFGSCDLYIEEVSDDFDSEVRVLEGEYGLWMTNADVQQHALTTPHTRLIVLQVEEYLTKLQVADKPVQK